MKGRKMAHAFIDDGHPEAAEYETNYIEFDASDPRKIREIIRQVKSYLKDRNQIQTNLFNPLYSSLSG
jgi:hypothetical protein